MEISVIGKSQVTTPRIDLGFGEVKVCSFSKNLSFAQISRLGGQSSSNSWPSQKNLFLLICKASGAHQVEAVISEKALADRRSKDENGVKLYVGLPLNAVSCSNTISHARAIKAGLKALKLLGVDGVELPVWWGVAEREAMGKYNWKGYLAIVEMVEKMGLKVHVSLCFHASEEARVQLPHWVSDIGESNPDIFFTDRYGQMYKDCLSLSVDELPVLDGKTPVQVYKDFCDDFRASFAPFFGSTISGVSIGLGPDGELRYPSHHRYGAGEFQCSDKNMLIHLKKHAESLGKPLWGLSGPHDAAKSDEMPTSNGFFKENGGSWESEYGDFFLSWYSQQLISHGERLLSLAASAFRDLDDVTVSGKLPLVHSWFKTRSHPAELTAGVYNTVKRDGYEGIVEMFARNSCKVILPGMDLAGENPTQLVKQIVSSCKKHGVEVSGQNASVSPAGFEQIKESLSGENGVGSFTYQRMGASFFSPDHFPAFTNMARSLSQPQMHPDDMLMPVAEVVSVPGKDLQMQTA